MASLFLGPFQLQYLDFKATPFISCHTHTPHPNPHPIHPHPPRGERGIRTPGTRKSTTVFETVPIDHSGISPIRRKSKKIPERKSFIPPFSGRWR